MWKGGVELSILVDKDLIAFRGLFLEINFQNESSFLVLLLIPTVAACSEQLIILLIQIEIESACRAEISGLHDRFYYTLRVLPASILYEARRRPLNRPMAIESDTGSGSEAP